MTMLKAGTRVLLTGGAGFIGSHLARALVGSGCPVRVLDDLSTGKRERLVALGTGLELYRADVRNPGAVEKASRGAQVIVHLAASPAGLDPMRAQEVHLGGALNVLNAARSRDRADRPRVVLCGSGAVYGKQPAFVLHEELAPRPAVPQAVMALASEQYGRVYRETWGVQVTNLRIFRTFGPDEDPERADSSVVAKLIRCALEGKSPAIFGDGQQTRDLVYVENVVNAVRAACAPEGCDHAEPLNVASGEAVSINHLWNLILDVAGKKRLAIEPTYVPAPPWDPIHARPQIQRSCQQLGWAPSVRLREGLLRTVQWFSVQRSDDPNAWFSPRADLPPPPPEPPRQAAGGGWFGPRKEPSVTAAPPRREPSGISPPPIPTRARSQTPPLPFQALDPPARSTQDTELELDDETDFQWAPVPPVPGMGR
jgi:nucleoside-diphosphate-sugar epimerase